MSPSVCVDINGVTSAIAAQIFAAIPPLLVLAGLLTTLNGELGKDDLSGTLRSVPS